MRYTDLIRTHISMNITKSRVLIVSCALAAASVAALLLLRRRNEPKLPEPGPSAVPGKVAVKPIVRENVAHAPMVAASTSRAVAVVCGADEATACRYEARNDALRSIARKELTLAQRAELW